MAFMKYARATVVRPHVKRQEWAEIRTAAKAETDVPENLIVRASEIVGQPFDPKDYLLTHCTIVASVDTYAPSDMKLGKVLDGGFRVNRKYADFRIKPASDRFLNNNLDGWSRGVLLKSYRTFVAGHNFCFAPGTRVLLASGDFCPIEDVVVGDEVFTHEGRVRKVTHGFVREFTGDIQEIYVDRFEKPILATGNHPFRTIDVDAPPLESYPGSEVTSQARYRRDQIVKFLRGEGSTFGTTQRVLPRLVSILQQDGPLTESEMVSAHGLSIAGARRVLRRETDFFVRRPMTEEEQSKRQSRTRRARVWELRRDAPLHRVRPIVARKGWVEACRLRVGDFLLGPERLVGHESREDEATLLGYYVAEGCLIGSPESPQGFVLSFGPHERKLAEHAQEIARRMFPGPTCNINLTQTSLRLNVYSADAGRWAYRMGGHLAPSKRLDPRVYTWNRESLLRLLGGWLAGDGNVHEATFRLRGTSTSEALARQMQYVAEIAGVKSCVVFERRRIGEVQSHVVMLVGGAPKTYDVIGRHHAWTVLVSKDSVHDIATRSRRWGDGLCRVREVKIKQDDLAWWKNCRVHRVADVRTTPYSGKVYNLEVEGDHSYVVEHGIAVHNCEHVQVEDLSKGRIIDAVARDVGESIYTDILIATDRKHTELIAAIESGKMTTLSMGCTITGSQCTKCGHWAADETEQCPCIKYEKGNTFYDEQGQKHRVAELCGNVVIDPTGGVQFIEASWVATPAFTGAVLRNVLEPTSDVVIRKAQVVLASPPPEWSSDIRRKWAGQVLPTTDAFTAGWDDDSSDMGDAGTPPAAPADPFKDTEESLHKYLLDRVTKRVKKDIDGQQIEETVDHDTSSTNEGLVKEAGGGVLANAVRIKMGKYRAVLDFVCRTASSDAELVDRVARLDSDHGTNVPVPIYRAALDVGSVLDHVDVTAYLHACRVALGRKPTGTEAKAMLRVGKLISRRGRALRDENESPRQSPRKER